MKNSHAHIFIIVFMLSVLLYSCRTEPTNISDYSVKVELNPHKIAPLSGVAQISTSEPSDIQITVLGETPISHIFEKMEGNQTLPILGLYAGTNNTVEIQMTRGNKTQKDTFSMETDTLPDYFPTISIDTLNIAKMESGMHLCDLHFAQDGKFHSKPMIFDHRGQVRWYLDLGFFDGILWPAQRLSDGAFLVGSKNEMFEYDMTGQQVKKIKLNKNYWIHHEILEIPDNQLLLAVGKGDANIYLEGKKIHSHNDFIILYDRNEDKVLKEWDLAEVMDVTRGNLIHVGGEGNWLHMNGLAFDPETKDIYMSAKHQGLAKITWNNELVWLLAPNKNWNKTGRKQEGFETTPFLLKAIDADNNPYAENVQIGDASVDDFDFPWGNHAPEIMKNGNILLFDNGFLRNWEEERKINYSRAVEYQIDAENKTVQQKWQYGKERGNEFFSFIICDVDELDNSNILITSGHITDHDQHYSKIVEVTYPKGEEVFEATLDFKDKNGNGEFAWGQFDILYRAERISLY